MNKSRSGWIALVLAGALGLGIGCGGSGGGGDDGSDGGTTGFTAAKLQDAGGAGTAALDTSYSLTDFSLKLIYAWGVETVTMARSAALPVTGLCTTGTLDAEYTDADESGTLTAGDTVVFTFSSCGMEMEDESLTFDGTLEVSAVEVTGTTWPEPPYTIALAFAFQPGFTVSGDDSSTTLSGGFTYTESTESGVAYSLSIEGGTLTFVDDDGTTTSTVRLTGFTASFTLHMLAGGYTAEVAGTQYDSDLEMTITYDTPTPFSGVTDGNPTAGVLVLTASDGSVVTVTVVVVDATTYADIALDEDGDGTPEQTIRVPWDDL